MRTTVLHIDNMCCSTEEQLIRNRLGRLSGVERLEFNLLEKELTVHHQLEDEGPIVQALDQLGLPGRVPRLRPATVGASLDWRTHLPLAISGMTALGAEGWTWLGGQEASPPVLALALASMLAGGRETLHKGWVALTNRTLNINFLMSVAILGAACLGQWPEAAMVTFLFALAEQLEAASLERARQSIRSLMELSPERAMMRTACQTGCCEGDWVEVPVEEVPLGARVLVRPGGRIPLDGVVAAGQSSVNQAPITGESQPVDKQPGDPVFAGTVNGHGSLEFEVTANHGQTTLDRIVHSVQQAQAQRAPTQRFVDRFAACYTPIVCGLALLVALLPPLVFHQAFFPWIYKALVLLVISCPCALVLSTPVTVVSGLASAARRGILIKGGVYLEEARRLRALALDKTGTLTVGRPGLTDTRLLSPELDETRALLLAASLEAASEHPVAQAVVEQYRARNGRHGLLAVGDFQALPGRGASGVLEGQRFFVGNHRLAEDNGVCGPEVEKQLFALESEGKSTVLLTTERDVLAVFAMADQVRPGARESVARLRELGVTCVMLTGDNPVTARSVAAQVGLSEIRANLLPQDKLKVLEDLLREHTHVGMVGDGVNDAPALARSSLGVTMGAAGTATALETADVALMNDDLARLPELVELSRYTVRVLRQNIFLAILIKVVFFALAVQGLATLWMAVFADMGGSLLVVANGLRLLRFSPAPSEPIGAGDCAGGCCHAHEEAPHTAAATGESSTR